MIGNYGAEPHAKTQTFEAIAIHRTEASVRASAKHSTALVTIHTDGVLLGCEEVPDERRAGFKPAFRLIAGRTYRVTVEEIQ